MRACDQHVRLVGGETFGLVQVLLCRLGITQHELGLRTQGEQFGLGFGGTTRLGRNFVEYPLRLVQGDQGAGQQGLDLAWIVAMAARLA